MKDLLDERASLSVYDPKVTREQMFEEFKYTLDVTPATVPGLDGLIVTAKVKQRSVAGYNAL